MREANAQMKLHLCADSSEPSLLTDTINTKIVCAGPHYVQKTTYTDDIYCYIFGRQNKYFFGVSNKMSLKLAKN